MTEAQTLPQHLGTLGFMRNPFPQTPDADCHFRTEGIKRQFTEALHCVEAGKGFVLLTGEVGTGKSTFLRCLMDELLAKERDVAFVFNTFLQGRELLIAINRDFGLDTGVDLADDIDRLNKFLIARHAAGRTCVVVIDDAQNLDAASLELLRLLSNLETRQNKLLQIVLSGQPELLDVLATPGFRQLASRIVQHVRLAPLNRAECARYIDFRIARAGSDGRISLTPAAQRAAYRHSRGNPRRVHLIMDRCLYGVMPSESREIGKRLVDTAASEVGIVTARPRALGAWMVAGIAGLSFGLVGWAAMRTPVPATSSAVHVAAEPAASTAVEPSGSAHVDVATPGSLPSSADAPRSRSSVPPAMVASPTQAVVALSHAVVVPPTQAIAMLQGPAAAAAKASAEAVPTPSKLPVAPVAAVPTAHPPFALRNDVEGNPIRWLQIRLADSGGYDGRIDGVVGPRTIEAYAAFRRAHGLPDSSDVDVAALALLEHPASAPPAIATPASAPSAIATPTSATRIPHG